MHTEFECQRKEIRAVVVRYQRRWFILMQNMKLGTAWTSDSYGVGGKARNAAISFAVILTTQEAKLPAAITTPIPTSKEEYTGTIDQNQRTCTLCTRRYRTHNLLSKHLQVCPAKHFGGMFIPHIPQQKVQ